ncbi:MAG TPA: hypothetical protein VKB70_00225, partial [Gaiellaceae bacterium]|nr:hypothetical protein [Gaiellaceae bacterium]
MAPALATRIDVGMAHTAGMAHAAVEPLRLRLSACPWCGSRRRTLDELRGGAVRDSCLRCGAEHPRAFETECEPAGIARPAAAVAATRWVAHAGLAAARPGGA